VIFLPGDHKVEAEREETFLEAYWRSGLLPLSDCGGRGTCGKCQIRFTGDAPSPNSVENDLLSPVALDAGYRLACQHRVFEDTVVEVAPRTEGRIAWKLEASLAKGTELDPPARRDSEGTGVLLDGRRLDCVTSPDRPILGLALDIGTTTLAGYLMDLETGVQEAALSLWNPQATYGADVISRIDFSEQREGGLKLLQDTVIDSLNRLIKGLLDQSGLQARDIYHVSVAGNPTMLHLLLGVEAGSIARAPYHPQFTEHRMVGAASLGLAVCPDAVVETLPLVSGYVGADTMAMALFLRLDERDEVCLAIDVGTNGEILLAKRGEIYACSTAAGPAFEGARISCGMRAEPGAIDSVSLDPKDGLVRPHTIGDAEPRGISGSGLVSVVAALLDAKLVSSSGRFPPADSLPEPWAPFFRGEGLQRQFDLSSDGAGRHDGGVYLSQKDVRELQLGKAAIAAGIRRLLDYAHLTPDDVEHVYLAGAFGSHLDPWAATRIGLLPGLSQERVVAVGNAAGAGAKMVLYSQKMREMVVHIAEDTRYVELSSDIEFNELFMNEMDFPTSSSE
jgi:uncharacterized 2Fe-2S/4Fe-4S cluster protein (DUF4445 family)